MAIIYNFLNNVWNDIKQENKNNFAFIFIILLLISLPFKLAVTNTILTFFFFLFIWNYKKLKFHLPFSLLLLLLLFVTAAIYAAFVSFSTPRLIWSSSIDSNRARKLPSPKPWSPLRWMISKKIGPITVCVKICSSSSRSFSVLWPSIRMRRRRSSSSCSPWFGRRRLTSS